ncbi:MAG: Crp/Fnr family transcriptional regulator [Cetobacterium sp.]
MKKIENLEKIKIFKGVKEEKLLKIFDSIPYNINKFEKNDIVLFRGDCLDGALIIIEGSLSAEMLKDNGDIQKIENLFEGDIIASAFIFGQKNIIPVDLIALSSLKILHLNKKNLLKIFKIEEKILVNFLNEISDKTQFLSNKIWRSFNKKTIKDKMLDYISENKVGNIFEFQQTVKELSELFGVSRPSLSRVISELIEEQFLKKISRKKYEINLKKNIDTK